jgi:hypothetical protein
MPQLSRWFVRAALIYLLVGFTLGGLILSAKGGAVDGRVWLWLLPHADILIVGWMVQLALGMSYWILPRIRVSGREGGDRGRTILAWSSFGLLNAGLLVGAGLPILPYWLPNQAQLSQAFPVGLLIQALALALYVIYAWPRILPTITKADTKSG